MWGTVNTVWYIASVHLPQTINFPSSTTHQICSFSPLGLGTRKDNKKKKMQYFDHPMLGLNSFRLLTIQKIFKQIIVTCFPTIYHITMQGQNFNKTIQHFVNSESDTKRENGSI